jgi:hypothetical protein
MRHCRLRIMRMTSKHLIVAEAVGKVLNPRVGFYQPLERAIIRLQLVVEIFDLPMLHALF